MTGRLREAFAALDPSHEPGEGCPEPARIWDAVHGTLAPREAQAVVEHVARCSSCAADWRSAREHGSVPALGPATRWGPWLAAAAAVLVGAALLVVAPWRWGPPAVYRDAGPEVRSLLPENEPLPRERALLLWSSPDPEAVYTVEVGLPDLTPLASARDLRESRFLVPEEALRAVETGGTVVWRVEARLPDGRRIDSPAFLHTVR